MPRYYEAEALIEFVKQFSPNINGETTLECVERAIRNAPIADVVPRSEVDRLEKELAKCYEELDKSTDFYCSFTQSKIQNCPIQAEIEKAKQEVAREIFEELGEVFLTIPIKGREKATIVDFKRYAELKKKYIGEKK